MHPSSQDAQQIFPDIWLGSYTDGRLSPEFLVVCAFPNFAQPHPDGVFISFGMHDREGAVPSEDDLDAFVSSVRPWVEGRGMPSYWHCQAGLNRSAFLLTYYLCSVRGFPASYVIAAIRDKRKSPTGLTPLFNQSFEKALLGWFPG